MGILISVVLPVYNVAPYLPKCLDSVLQNTYDNLEVICVNDGSTDDSLKVLNRYAEADKRIRVIDQTNQGVSEARNAGIRAATGDYISFIDPDDYVHHQYFEALLFARDAVDADYVVGSFLRVEEDTEYSDNAEETNAIDIASLSIREMPIDSFFENHLCRTYSCGRLLRRKLVADVLFDKTIRIGEDGVFNAELWEAHPNMKT